MTKRNYDIFRQNYEDKISKKLEIGKEEFYIDFYNTKLPIGTTIFGGLLLLYGLYTSIKIHTFYGLLIIFFSLFCIYGGLKKTKVVFKISKNGIWTEEFGFIYFRHIDHFEFYRYVGKTSSEYLKIYIKDHKLYKMEEPYLEQSISQINGSDDLKKSLDDALKVANKRNENKNYR